MKIALFKDVKYDWTSPTPWPAEDDNAPLEGYTRVSEIVDVEFPPLSKDEVVQQALDCLDEQEKKLRNDFQKALDGLNTRRAELQQLPFIPASRSSSVDEDVPY